MNIVVTGSIAFDSLMSFPGRFTEHFLPEPMSGVRLSFLLDTMDTRRGRCAHGDEVSAGGGLGAASQRGVVRTKGDLWRRGDHLLA